MKCAGAYKRHVCRAANLGDWAEASSCDETHPDWVFAPLTEYGEIALHIAVSRGHTSFVEMLVERMRTQDMEIPDVDGNNAFCRAAISGNVEIAIILLRNNSRLVWIRGQNGMLPIQLAFSNGQPHMVKFLFEITCEDMRISLSFQDIAGLFFLALAKNNYSKHS